MELRRVNIRRKFLFPMRFNVLFVSVLGEVVVGFTAVAGRYSSGKL
jgi:hypothetical protein